MLLLNKTDTENFDKRDIILGLLQVNEVSEELMAIIEADLDEKVKISEDDITAGYLNAKLSTGVGLNKTINNSGSETLAESMTIASDGYVAVSANDAEIQTLSSKLIAGDNITLTVNHDVGTDIETMTIAAGKMWVKRNIALPFSYADGVYSYQKANFPYEGLYHVDIKVDITADSNKTCTLNVAGSGETSTCIDENPTVSIDHDAFEPDGQCQTDCEGMANCAVTCALRVHHWLHSLQGSKIVLITGASGQYRFINVTVTGLAGTITESVIGSMDVFYLTDEEGEFEEET